VRSLQDEGRITAIQTQIMVIIDSIKSAAEDIFTSKLGNPTRNIEYFCAKDTKDMLEDLYFGILPKFVGIIKNAVDFYSNQDPFETSGLQEITTLVKIVQDLSTEALQQPTDHQPQPKSKNATYQISQPTRHNLPLIREFHTRLFEELNRRERAEQLAEEERLRPEREQERERRRLEEEHRRSTENRRKIEAIHRRQKQEFEKKASEKLWGRILLDNIAEEEAKMAAARRDRSRRKGKKRQISPDLGVVEQNEDIDPFADDPVERISVFGSNNTHENSRPRPLSNEDRNQFIDIMRYTQGKISPCERKWP